MSKTICLSQGVYIIRWVSKQVLQAGSPSGFSKRVLQAGSPSGFSKRVLQADSPSEFSKWVLQVGSPSRKMLLDKKGGKLHTVPSYGNKPNDLSKRAYFMQEIAAALFFELNAQFPV
jgi:hypothetical protein